MSAPRKVTTGIIATPAIAYLLIATYAFWWLGSSGNSLGRRFTLAITWPKDIWTVRRGMAKNEAQQP